MTIHRPLSSPAMEAMNAAGVWVSPDHVIDYEHRDYVARQASIPTSIKTIAVVGGGELHLTNDRSVKGITEIDVSGNSSVVKAVTTWFHNERPTLEVTEVYDTLVELWTNNAYTRDIRTL